MTGTFAKGYLKKKPKDLKKRMLLNQYLDLYLMKFDTLGLMVRSNQCDRLLYQKVLQKEKDINIFKVQESILGLQMNQFLSN